MNCSKKKLLYSLTKINVLPQLIFMKLSVCVTSHYSGERGWEANRDVVFTTMLCTSCVSWRCMNSQRHCSGRLCSRMHSLLHVKMAQIIHNLFKVLFYAFIGRLLMFVFPSSEPLAYVVFVYQRWQEDCLCKLYQPLEKLWKSFLNVYWLLSDKRRNNTLRIVIMTDELHSLHSTKEEFHVRNQLDL